MMHVLTIGNKRIMFKPPSGLDYRPKRGMIGRGGDDEEEEEYSNVSHLVPYEGRVRGTMSTPIETSSELPRHIPAEVFQMEENRPLHVTERRKMSQHEPKKVKEDVKDVIERTNRNIEEHRMLQEDKPKQRAIALKKVFKKLGERGEPVGLMKGPQKLKVLERKIAGEIKAKENKSKKIISSYVTKMKKRSQAQVKGALSESKRQNFAKELAETSKKYKEAEHKINEAQQNITGLMVSQGKALGVYSGLGIRTPNLTGIIARTKKEIDDLIESIPSKRGKWKENAIAKKEQLESFLTHALKLKKIRANLIEYQGLIYLSSYREYYGFIPPKEAESSFQHGHKVFSPAQLEKQIAKIEKDIPKVKLIPMDIITNETFKEEIENINQNIIYNIYITDEILKYTPEQKLNASTLSDSCVNIDLVNEYLDSLGIKNMKITPGKALEFATAGLDNINAKILFELVHPELKVSDFEIEEIYQTIVRPYLVSLGQKKEGEKDKSMGGSFCVDHIDLRNHIMNEMKDYKSHALDYERGFNINLKLKHQYLNRLKRELIKALREEDEITIMEIIFNLRDKESFERSFYRDVPYVGFPITMNKWDKIDDSKIVFRDSEEAGVQKKLIESKDETVEDEYEIIYNTPSPNTKAQIEEVAKNQKQKFRPHMKKRFIVGLTQTTGSVEYIDAMNEAMRDKFFSEEGERYEFTITVRMLKNTGVYNYTEDELILDDNILNTYRTAFSLSATKKYNGVLIPIEKFKIKGLNG